MNIGSWFLEKRKSIKWKILFIMLIILFVISLGTGFLNSRSAHSQMIDTMKEQLKSIGDSFQHDMETRIADMKIAINFMLNDQDVLQSFAKHDRKALIRKYQNLFDYTLKPRFKLDIFQFHLPPATSFYRVYEPGKFGDDLSSFRKMVLEANRDKVAKAGLEVGKFGASIRIVYPVTYKGKHVGTVELGSDYIKILEKTATALNVFFSIAIKNDMLNNAKIMLKGNTIQKGNLTYYAFSKNIAKSIIEHSALSNETQIIEFEDQDYAVGAMELKDYKGLNIGSVLIMKNITKEMAAMQSASNKVILILITFVSILFILLYYILTKSVFKPLRDANKHLLLVTDGDLSHDMDFSSDDEIGQLIQSIRGMKDSLRKIVGQIREKEEMLANSAVQFSSLAENMKDTATAMSDKTTAVSAATEEMSVNMNTVSTATEQSNSNINLIAISTKEMTSTVEEISGNTGRAQQITANAVQNVAGATEKIKSLSAAAVEIDKVIEVIVEIAEQTKLLALNATIEAARAGEAGKGFAVVANEVKELAHQTGQATEGITAKIKAMQESTTGSVDEINKINKSINEVNEIITSIAGAVEEQAVTTREIANSVDQAAEGVQQVSVNITQAAEVSADVASDIAGVNAISEDVKNAGSSIMESANALKMMGEELKKAVEMFKL